MSLLLASLLLASPVKTVPALRIKGTQVVTDKGVPIRMRGVNAALGMEKSKMGRLIGIWRRKSWLLRKSSGALLSSW